MHGVCTLVSEGRVGLDPRTKADMLNCQFSSVFTKEDVNHLPQKNPSPYPVMSPIVVDNAGVYRLLPQLNQRNACGPDNNHAVFLKSCVLELSNMLSFIIQQSLDTQTLPLDWRMALVTPVFKKGDKSSPENYRPISVTCSAYAAKLQNTSLHLSSGVGTGGSGGSMNWGL